MEQFQMWSLFMKNKRVWIYEKNNPSSKKTLFKLHNLGVNIYQINNKENKTLYLVDIDDYKRIKKYLIIKFRIETYTGMLKIKNYFKKNYFYLMSLLFGIILIFFLSNIIVKVNVIHSKQSVRELLQDELEEHGIKRLTFKKEYKELNQIKQKILNKHKNQIEWLEIEKKGMIYVVRVEERIIVAPEKEHSYCNIISKKDGIITKILINKGTSLVKMGSVVKKDDTLVTGDILLNEETVEQVCAKGKIYGEVWYKIDIDMPTFYYDYLETGEVRNNLMIKHKDKESIILNSRLKNKIVRNKKIGSILGYSLFVQKEVEVKKIKRKYNENEIIDAAIIKGLQKLKITLKKEEKIISRNVLKKSLNNSKIYLELFVTVEEEIGEIQVLQ